MKIAAIIAEANPLHNGHAWLFSQARERFGADALIVLMSGDFVQRGEPALLDKHRRARAALASGADLVLMLPTLYSVAPAEIFARGAVLTLNASGVVDTLLFGSEAGDLAPLQKLAAFSPDDQALRAALMDAMQDGASYPKALTQALARTNPADAALTALLENAPNNVLGVEYLRSLAATKSSVTPATAARLQASESVTDAAGLRGILRCAQRPDGKVPASLAPFVPTSSLMEIHDVLTSGIERAVFSDDLSPMLRYRLALDSGDALFLAADAGGDLSRRIAAKRLSCTGFDDFAALLKVKAFTLARIRRVLLQILLDIRRDERDDALQKGRTILRVLGLRDDARWLLKEIGARRDPDVPLIVRGADFAAAARADEATARLIALDQRSGALYDRLAFPRTPGKSEEEKPPVILR